MPALERALEREVIEDVRAELVLAIASTRLGDEGVDADVRLKAIEILEAAGDARVAAFDGVRKKFQGLVGSVESALQ